MAGGGGPFGGGGETCGGPTQTVEACAYPTPGMTEGAPETWGALPGCTAN
jgi:hypothetical protein